MGLTEPAKTNQLVQDVGDDRGKRATGAKLGRQLLAAKHAVPPLLDPRHDPLLCLYRVKGLGRSHVVRGEEKRKRETERRRVEIKPRLSQRAK